MENVGEPAVEIASFARAVEAVLFRTYLPALQPVMISVVQLFLILALSYVFELISVPGCFDCVVAGLIES